MFKRKIWDKKWYYILHKGCSNIAKNSYDIYSFTFAYGRTVGKELIKFSIKEYFI